MKKLILSIVAVMCLISCSKKENSIDTKVIPKQDVYGRYIGVSNNYTDSLSSEPIVDTFIIKELRDFYTDSLIIATSTNSPIPDTLSGYDTLYKSTRKSNSTPDIIETDTTKIIFNGLTMKLEKKKTMYFKNNLVGSYIITFVGIKQ